MKCAFPSLLFILENKQLILQGRVGFDGRPLVANLIHPLCCKVLSTKHCLPFWIGFEKQVQMGHASDQTYSGNV